MLGSLKNLGRVIDLNNVVQGRVEDEERFS
jgi:hypothetical protein